MRRFVPFALVAAAAAAGAVVYFFDPAQSSFYPRCVFHFLTGLQCPGCGLTRATHQMLHGHFAEAFRLNAFGVVFLPIFLITVAAMRGRVLDRPWMGWTAVVLVLGWGITRNLVGI